MTCAHRIRLEEPQGTFTMGRCTLCGFERVYSNVFADDLPGRGNWAHINAAYRAQDAALGRYANQEARS